MCDCVSIITKRKCCDCPTSILSFNYNLFSEGFDNIQKCLSVIRNRQILFEFVMVKVA